MPAPSIPIQGWASERARRRSVTIHGLLFALMLATLAGVAGVLILRRPPAPVQCTAVPEPPVHREMQPILTPGGPVPTPPPPPSNPMAPMKRRRKEGGRRDKRRRRARREGAPAVVIQVARGDGTGAGWRALARERLARATAAEMRHLELDRDLLAVQAERHHLLSTLARGAEVAAKMERQVQDLAAERDTAQARIVELLGGEHDLRRQIANLVEVDEARVHHMLRADSEAKVAQRKERDERLRAEKAERARDGWRGRCLYAERKGRRDPYGSPCPGCLGCEPLMDHPLDLCGGSAWVATAEPAKDVIVQAAGGDIEREIEASFWAFDAERKRTGAERDAYKGQMRAMAGWVASNEATKEATPVAAARGPEVVGDGTACTQCGAPTAYIGAVFCGAGCAQSAEMGLPPLWRSL